MRRAILVALAVVLAGTVAIADAAMAGSFGRYEVSGVEGDDMLKMRAGPGLGYVVILGLPNGTILHVQSCQRIGGTRWCSVSLDRAREIKGYVSGTYLRKM